MKKIMLVIITTLTLMSLTSCLSEANKQLETYAIISAKRPLQVNINAYLYDVSHEYDVGVYIVDDVVLDDNNDYAKKVYDRNYVTDIYDSFVLLAISNNIREAKNDEVFYVDILVNGEIAKVINDNVCNSLINDFIKEANRIKDNSDDSYISEIDYENLLYYYVDQLIPYLK